MATALAVAGLVGVVLVVVVLYGRSERQGGAAEQQTEEAEGNAEKRARVNDKLAERPDRESARDRIRRLLHR